MPHLWPSRVKVFFLAILTSVINFSVFQYLHNANVAYLNLSSPASEEIVCKLPREECASNPDPASCTVDLEDRRFWRGHEISSVSTPFRAPKHQPPGPAGRRNAGAQGGNGHELRK